VAAGKDEDVRSENGPVDLRAGFEAKLTGLRGRRLSAVDYWDVHSFGPESPEWDYGDWHHAVMGVQLGTGQGPVTVTWTGTFYPYGVEVFHEPITDHLVLHEDGPQRVGPDSCRPGVWAPYLGTPVCGGGFHWERLEIGPGQRSDGTIVSPPYTVDVPTALRLDFPAGAVWFVAGIPQFPDTRRVFIPGDEIVVVFSAGRMRDMGFDDPAFLR
jgi:hypothetical protein